MAKTLRDLQGWEIITTDEQGNIIDGGQKRLRRRGAKTECYLKRSSDGTKLGRGDSVVMHNEAAGTYSVYMIQELRINTLNNIVELWALTYLRWFEVNPLAHYRQFNPDANILNRPLSYYNKIFSETANKNELYLTAELAELQLSNFIRVANVMDSSKWEESKGSVDTERDFMVHYICEPTGEKFVDIDIEDIKAHIKKVEPREAQEYLKDLTLPSKRKEIKGSSPKKKNKTTRMTQNPDAGTRGTDITDDEDSNDVDSSDYQSPSDAYISEEINSDEISADELEEEEEEEEDNNDDDEEQNEPRRINSPRKRGRKIKLAEGDTDASIQPSPKRRGRKPKDPSKPRQMLLISSCRANNTPVIRKFTKKNVARAKKKYTPFSKRFKSIAAIPDLNSLPEFYGNSSELMASSFENKLKTTQKHQIVETIFSKVKKQLNSSYVKEEILKSANFQDYLPARENEFASIYLSAYSAIESDSATTIYVAGTPGVGKTLTVREVVKELLSSSAQQEIPDFLYVEINGLKMVKPTDCYETLWNKISGERLTWAASMESLEFYFKRVPKNKKKTIVVLLDELDAMVTKSQDIMYNFFNWTTYENAKIIVIAVANTMDLPERQLGNKVTSRIGFTRIMFTGYTHEELKNIIDLRLKGLNDSFFYVDTKTGNAILMDVAGHDATVRQTLPNDVKKVRLRMSADAIEIASRKVASVSGDARRALKVCKRAAEIAEKHYMAKHGYGYDGKMVIEDESEGQMYDDEDKDLIENDKANKDDGNDDDDGVQTVHITHVMKALNETLNSHAITFMTRLSFTAKLFIYALLNLMKKNGSQEQELGDIVDEIKLLIEVNGSNKFVMEIAKTLFQQGSDNISEQLRIISWDFVLNQLLDAGILFKQTMKNDRICCVKLNISVEEAKRAMNDDETLRNL
ncbi:origin recognition complex subunit 1 [Saccharomyces paradoxus]|uniref:Origin recognition complex subunit 1 n=1 Tax=Saccharomyces paradoxus TaxID=27291 RepID=A0A8B8UWV9_SACPA|nr:Orc1 [Saccharomyces paradoxus]QHS75222.1 Orc1 [Saccharomyces paradoxus]